MDKVLMTRADKIDHALVTAIAVMFSVVCGYGLGQYLMVPPAPRIYATTPNQALDSMLPLAFIHPGERIPESYWDYLGGEGHRAGEELVLGISPDGHMMITGLTRFDTCSNETATLDPEPKNLQTCPPMLRSDGPAWWITNMRILPYSSPILLKGN